MVLIRSNLSCLTLEGCVCVWGGGGLHHLCLLSVKITATHWYIQDAIWSMASSGCDVHARAISCWKIALWLTAACSGHWLWLPLMNMSTQHVPGIFNGRHIRVWICFWATNASVTLPLSGWALSCVGTPDLGSRRISEGLAWLHSPTVNKQTPTVGLCGHLMAFYHIFMVE